MLFTGLWVVGSYGGLQCHMRDYTGSQCAVLWSMSGRIGSWGGLKCHIREYTGSQGTVLWSMSGSIYRVLGWSPVSHESLYRL